MRLVDGRDLKALLAERPAPERVLGILDQIAGALDAAHRRGLVHRDVKPANILLDADEQAYLTDFGITKDLAGDSTGSGHLVGTLEYLAPEQIRGESVDGRTDQYSLACVLYEGLTGSPPFRRRTEAETLWGHMQEPPPHVDPPALDAALRRGLAKDRDDRFPTCADLVAAARAAIAPERASPAAPRHRRGRRRLVGAGAALAVAAAAAAVLAMTGDSEQPAAPMASGIAAFDGATGRFASLAQAPAPPSNVAVGESAIWALNTEERTVTKLDPATHKVVRRFSIGGIPSDIAAGAGAVWVGRGGGASHNSTVAISRVDPRTTTVTHTTRLRRGAQEGWPSGGYPGIAVGGGAVWVVDPDGSISRLDPRNGRVVATIRANASTIAAGDAGVWFASADSSEVRRIDPRTNRVGQTIRVGSDALRGIAVGAGAVWAAGEHEGVVWRIDPGSHPVTRTIDVGPGVSYLTFGDGALWAATYVDGRISRIDPRTNRVTATDRVGAPQALAAGSGAVWVSVAGAGRDGSAARVRLRGRRERRPDARRRHRLRPPAPGTDERRTARDGRRDPRRAAAPRVPRGTLRRRLRLLRHVDRAERNLGGPPLRGERQRVCGRGPARRRGRPVQLGLRRCDAPDPQPRRGRGDPAHQSHQHGPRPTRPVSISAKWGGYRDEPRVFYPTGVRNYMRLLGGDDLAGVGDALSPAGWAAAARTSSTTAAGRRTSSSPGRSGGWPAVSASGSPAPRASTPPPGATPRSSGAQRVRTPAASSWAATCTRAWAAC